jgi:hypothetical protein
MAASVIPFRPKCNPGSVRRLPDHAADVAAFARSHRDTDSLSARTGGAVNGSARVYTCRLWLLGLMLGLPHFAPAAETQLAQKAEQIDQELSQILVEGRKPEKNPQKVIDWMARLVGEFAFEGEVDLHAKGRPEDLHPVRGSGECIGFGPAPAVRCEISVRWTPVRVEDRGKVLGGVSNLNPATMLFGFEKDRTGIRYMLLDSDGIAEGALGYVVEDTLVSRTPCVNIPGQCERVARITAHSDLQMVDIKIDLVIDYEPAVHYHLVMQRVPGSKAVVVSGPKVFAEPESR